MTSQAWNPSCCSFAWERVRAPDGNRRITRNGRECARAGRPRGGALLAPHGPVPPARPRLRRGARRRPCPRRPRSSRRPRPCPRPRWRAVPRRCGSSAGWTTTARSSTSRPARRTPASPCAAPTRSGRSRSGPTSSTRRSGKNARILFYPETPTGSYRYWTVLEGEAALFPRSDKPRRARGLEKNPGAAPTWRSSSRRSRTSRAARATTTAASPSAARSPFRTSCRPPARRRRRPRRSARLEQAAHREGAQEAHGRGCRRRSAASSTTSSPSSRTSSATRS